MKKATIFIAMVSMLLLAAFTAIALSNGIPEDEVYASPPVNTEGLCHPLKVVQEAAPEYVTLYTDADVTAIAQMLWGEARGCTVDNQMKCVWCVLNRVDDPRYPDSIIGVVSQPYQFHGYSPNFPATDELKSVALDVLTRWSMEKQGAEVYRELPSSYVFFTGNGVENVFREEYI